MANDLYMQCKSAQPCFPQVCSDRREKRRSSPPFRTRKYPRGRGWEETRDSSSSGSSMYNGYVHVQYQQQQQVGIRTVAWV